MSMPTSKTAFTPWYMFLLKSFGADINYSPGHLSDSFGRVFFESRKAYLSGNSLSPYSRIDYNTTISKWVHTSNLSKTTAFSMTKEEAYVLGKHNWTVSNDHQQCHMEMGKDKQMEYSKELKLSGCDQGFRFDKMGKLILEADAEFTCDDGQCVSMVKRCDQLPDCEDGSDEEGCRLFSLGKVLQ